MLATTAIQSLLAFKTNVYSIPSVFGQKWFKHPYNLYQMRVYIVQGINILILLIYNITAGNLQRFYGVDYTLRTTKLVMFHDKLVFLDKLLI